MIWWNKCFDSFLNPKGFDWFSNQSNNMNTKQFSFLLVLVLFKSQVILLVLSKSQGIWSVERNGLVLFKSQGSWWFLIIYYSISIEWQKIIWTQNNFSPCLFGFFLNPKLFNWFFLNSKGFVLKEMVWFFLNPMGVENLLQHFIRITENNMNTKQFPYLFFLSLFQSQGLWLEIMITNETQKVIQWVHIIFL